MLGKCKADDGLPKDGMEQERVRLEPLIDAFVEKSNEYLNTFKETEGDNDELIEDLNDHADYINLHWQRFLAFKGKLIRKLRKRLSRISAQIKLTWK